MLGRNCAVSLRQVISMEVEGWGWFCPLSCMCTALLVRSNCESHGHKARPHKYNRLFLRLNIDAGGWAVVVYFLQKLITTYQSILMSKQLSQSGTFSHNDFLLDYGQACIRNNLTIFFLCGLFYLFILDYVSS